mmetsp:Transcript_6148/g.23248  ORF Transcript_6148/g.23248 Transcript_6148/m.23248 type:complete len:189 (-) Transcript_6148:19-585(-)
MTGHGGYGGGFVGGFGKGAGGFVGAMANRGGGMNGGGGKTGGYGAGGAYGGGSSQGCSNGGGYVGGGSGSSCGGGGGGGGGGPMGGFVGGGRAQPSRGDHYGFADEEMFPKVAKKLADLKNEFKPEALKAYRALQQALQQYSTPNGSRPNFEHTFRTSLDSLFPDAWQIDAKQIGSNNQWEVCSAPQR